MVSESPCNAPIAIAAAKLRRFPAASESWNKYMPIRNLVLIVFTVVAALLCYQEATHNYYAGIVSETMDIIEDQYIEEVPRRELFESAMRGMTDHLDPHSIYFSPEELEPFDEDLNQKFGGVGIEVDLSERPTIAAVADDSPAARAGLQPGDVIETIDGEDISLAAGNSERLLASTQEKLRGAPGSYVSLELRRAGSDELLPFRVARVMSPSAAADESSMADSGDIGVTLKTTMRITVITPLPESPALAAGLLPGDVIASIDGQNTENVAFDDSISMMKGPPGEPVELQIRRRGESQLLPITVVRQEIKIESVKGDLRREDGSWQFHLADHPRIGYVRLTRNFGESTVDELREALKFKGHSVDAVILDLRGNQGGLLTAAVETCDMFVDRGVIVTTRGRDGVIKSKYEANSVNTLVGDLPMVVLTNGASASASEIVAACLQDHKRAIVVGERTWGKGTVQNVIRLEGGKSALKLTTASYWRPSEKNIHRHEDDGDDADWGVRPNPGFEVKLENGALRDMLRQRRDRDVLPIGGVTADDFPTVQDGQLSKAVEYLEQQLSNSGK